MGISLLTGSVKNIALQLRQVLPTPIIENQFICFQNSFMSESDGPISDKVTLLLFNSLRLT